MKKIYGISSFVKKNMREINNLLRFPLQYASESKGVTSYRFDGINDRINLTLSCNEADVWYTYQENMRDWLFDFSLEAGVDSQGRYFCTECKIPKFKTEYELYHSHFIKDIILMQKKQFRRENYLIYFSSKDKGFFSTKIVKGSDLFLALGGRSVENLFRAKIKIKRNGELKVVKYLDDFENISIEKVVL